MIIIVGASVSDVEMVIIIRRFHKCSVQVCTLLVGK